MASISPAALLRAINDIYLSRLFSGVATTFVVYDWILVFGDEFETIYRSRWSIPKILFYYIRVVTPPGIILGTIQLIDFRPDLSKQFCQGWAIFVVFAMLTSICAANGLLTLRLIALYKRKTSIVWFIGTFYVATYITVFALTIISLIQFHSTIFYSTTLRLCASLGHSSLMPAIWYAPAAFETFVFSMTLYRAWQDAALISGTSSAPLLTVLYRDGMISFIVMAGVRVWNIWIFLKAPLSSYNMGSMILWAVNAVLTTRVYMNLVWLVQRPVLGGDNHPTTNPTFGRATASAANNSGGATDSYAYNEDVGGPRTQQSVSKNYSKHTLGEFRAGPDVPLKVWK